MNLTSTTVIKDLSVIKVVQLDPDTTTIVLYPVDPTISSIPSGGQNSEDSSSGSAHTDDTIILSSCSPESSNPLFSNDTECQLQRGNDEYTRSKSRLTPCSKMLSDILEKVAEKVYTYKAYPTDADFSDVAESLTRSTPA